MPIPGLFSSNWRTLRWQISSKSFKWRIQDWHCQSKESRPRQNWFDSFRIRDRSFSPLISWSHSRSSLLHIGLRMGRRRARSTAFIWLEKYLRGRFGSNPVCRLAYKCEKAVLKKSHVSWKYHFFFFFKTWFFYEPFFKKTQSTTRIWVESLTSAMPQMPVIGSEKVWKYSWKIFARSSRHFFQKRLRKFGLIISRLLVRPDNSDIKKITSVHFLGLPYK